MRSLSRFSLLAAVFLCCLGGQTTPPNEGVLRRAQRLEPRNFNANLVLGQFLLESGRAAEAVQFLNAAVRLKPADIPARHDLAVAFIEIKRLSEAETLIRALPPSATATHLEALWLAASGQALPAAEKFQKAAEAEASEKHLFDWGNHLLHHGAPDPALKIFRYAVERFPKSARLLVAQGVAQYALSEFDAAARSVCAGVDLDPADLRPLSFLGMMTDLSPESALLVRERLKNYAKLYPRHAQAQYFYGLSLTRSESPAAAEPFLRRALALDARLPEARLELGKLYADSGRHAEAIEQLQAALRLAPDHEAVHYRLGQLYQRSGQTQLANQHLAEYRRLHAAKEAQKKRN